MPWSDGISTDAHFNMKQRIRILNPITYQLYNVRQLNFVTPLPFPHLANEIILFAKYNWHIVNNQLIKVIVKILFIFSSFEPL